MALTNPATASSQQFDIEVGTWLDGTAVNISWPAPHMLVSGTTGAGKSGWTASIIGALASEHVEMVGIDMKNGIELGPWRKRFDQIAETPQQATELLAELRQQINNRNELIKQQGVKKWDTSNGPYLLLIVDELAELGSLPADVLVNAIEADTGDKDAASEIRRAKDELGWRQSLLASLARISRAAGVTIITATQYPLAAIVGADLRSNLGGRISCRQTSKEGIDIALGAGWRETINPRDISHTTPGVAHVLGIADTHRPQLAKAHHVTDEAIEKRIQQTTNKQGEKQ